MTLFPVWLAVSLSQSPAAPVPSTHTIQAGDTCASLIRRFFSDTVNGDAVFHALNPQLGAKPHFLKPGQVVQVRDAPDAILSFLRPNVERRSATVVNWFKAQVNDPLKRFDQVSTKEGAGAVLTFEDETKLQMRENALVVVLGRTTAARADERKKRGIELVQGEARLTMSMFAKSAAPLEIHTPAASMRVERSDAKVAVDAQRLTRISQFRGQAKVKSQGRTVDVKENQGTRIKEGEAPETPRDLLKPPAWASTRVVAVGAAPSNEVKFDFSPVVGAESYRLEIASDESFNTLLSDQQLSSNSGTSTLAPGTYFARVASVDNVGLQGPSAPVAVSVLTLNHDAPWHLGQTVELTLPENTHLELNSVPVTVPYRLVQLGKLDFSVKADNQTLGDFSIEVEKPPFGFKSTPAAVGSELTLDFESPLAKELTPSIDGEPMASVDRKHYTKAIVAAVGASGTKTVVLAGQPLATVDWTSGTTPPAQDRVDCSLVPQRFGQDTGNAAFPTFASERCYAATVQGVGSLSPASPLGFWLGGQVTPLRWLTVAANLSAPKPGQFAGSAGFRFHNALTERFSLGGSLDTGLATSSALLARALGGLRFQYNLIDLSTAHGLTLDFARGQIGYAGTLELGATLSRFRISGAVNGAAPFDMARAGHLQAIVGADARFGAFVVGLSLSQRLATASATELGVRLGLVDHLFDRTP